MTRRNVFIVKKFITKCTFYEIKLFMNKITTYNDFRAYIRDRLKSVYGTDRGHLVQLAQTANIQPSYFSRVMKGEAQLSLEQAALMNSYLHHEEFEEEYFLLLVQYSRSGSEKVRKFTLSQMQALKEKEKSLHIKIGASKNKTDQEVLFQSWSELAVLSCLSIDNLNSPKKIADHLGMSLDGVLDCLSTLIENKCIEFRDEKYCQVIRQFHLPHGFKFLDQYHSSIRLKAVERIQNKKNQEGEMYSSTISISKKDLETIQSLISNTTKEIKKIIKDSKPEVVALFSWDIFELS